MFRRSRIVLSAVAPVAGSVTTTRTVTVCCPIRVVRVTPSWKFPFGPAFVVPLNWPLEEGEAPAVTRTRPLAIVLPEIVKLRPTAAFCAGL